MSEGIKFLTAVVPELANVPLERVKQLWREWANSQPPDVRLWLKDPLSPSQRRTLQFGFAAEYYQTHMLIAFENAQEERRQKMLAQDPRNRPHVPILEAAGMPVAPELEPAKMVKRELPDGTVLYAETEEEADELVQFHVERATRQNPEIGDLLLDATKTLDSLGDSRDVPWVDNTGGSFEGGGASGGWDDGRGAAAGQVETGSSDASSSADTSSSSSDVGSGGGDS